MSEAIVESLSAKLTMLAMVAWVVEVIDAGRKRSRLFSWSAAACRLDAAAESLFATFLMSAAGLLTKLTLMLPAGVPACVSVLPSLDVKFFEVSTVSGFPTRSRSVKSSVSPALPLIVTLPNASPSLKVFPLDASLTVIAPE